MATGGGEWLAKFLFDQGLRGDDLKRMWAIGMRESGGRPGVDNAGTNRDGSTDYGLFQINGSAHGARIKEKFGWSMDDLRDPVKNFTVMRWMSNNGQDLSAWGVANPDGSVSGWAANIGDAQRSKFTSAMNTQMSKFDSVAKKTGIDVGAAATGTTGTGKGETLTQAQLEARYGYAKNVIWSNKELRALWKEATDPANGYMTADEFKARLKSTDWYRNNAEYARTAWVAQQTGGADWAAQQQEAALKVQAAAVKAGVWDTLSPEQRAQLQHRYIFEGWNDPAREPLMMKELAAALQDAPEGKALGGDAGTIEQSLRKTALRNGLRFDAAYYTGAAKSVLGGLTTADDWAIKMREQAASMWPPYREQIMGGMDARDLASGYINTYAQTMEMDPDSIDLNDPVIRGAMTGVDEKGNPRPMGLWEFEQSLRAKPEWVSNTKQGQDSTVTAGMGVLRRMGIFG